MVQGSSPAFDVTDVTNFTPGPERGVAREVKGTFTVPCYLAPNCAPGAGSSSTTAASPPGNGDWTANFDCIIPRSAVAGAVSRARPSLYGHGLFGSAAEVSSSGQAELANTYNFVLCATDEIGMSSNDLGEHRRDPQDLSVPRARRPPAAGAAQRALPGPAMIHPPASAAPPRSTSTAPGTPSVIDRSHLYYDGNSQGGIMGGALTAVSPDFTRAALGVPAMRYSLLLPALGRLRQFAAVLYPRYPDELARPLMLSLIQMLWDRGEPTATRTG